MSEKLNSAACEGRLWCFWTCVYAELSPGTDFDPKQLESLKRRCDRRIQHSHVRTHTHKHTYTATLMHTITQQKQDALLELHQLRKQFVKGKPASVFKARPGDRFPPHRGLFFSAGKEVTRVKVVVRQECNRIWKLLFFSWSQNPANRFAPTSLQSK